MKINTSKLQAIILSCLLAVCSCNDANKQTAQNIEDTVQAKVDTAVARLRAGAQKAASEVAASVSKNEDSAFAVRAALTNNAELKVLQAGIDKGTDKDLKAHATMMLAYHKKLGEKVKSYSAGKGYILPDGDEGNGDNAIAALDKNSKGADWDKAWARHMVSAHEDAISMFETGEKAVKDEDLRKIIDGALPTLHSHLDMMKSLRDKLGK